jgi:hypothetical protein
MGDTSVTKVESKHAPRGEQGQKYLASGIHIAMRLWEHEPPGTSKRSPHAITRPSAMSSTAGPSCTSRARWSC